MAPKIERDAKKTKAVIVEVFETLNDCIDAGADVGDLAHALTFILCIYKFKFEWTTEQVLQLYEEYMLKMEKALGDDEPQEPYGEA
jgi:hypothetical protein